MFEDLLSGFFKYFLSLKHFMYFYVYGCFACVCPYAMYIQCLRRRPKEGIRSPRTEVRDSCELHVGAVNSILVFW